MFGRPAGAFAGATTIVLVMGAGTTSGCSVLCSEKREVVEVEYGSFAEDGQRALLSTYRQSGYNCDSDGAIRNAFGATIGRRYVCTKCD